MGPTLSIRYELYDFIDEEMEKLEAIHPHRIEVIQVMLKDKITRFKIIKRIFDCQSLVGCIVAVCYPKPVFFEPCQKLQKLLDNNSNLNMLYIMKEQLQELWSAKTVKIMDGKLEAWCKLALML